MILMFQLPEYNPDVDDGSPVPDVLTMLMLKCLLEDKEETVNTLCVYLKQHFYVWYAFQARTDMWKAEDNFVESTLFLPHMVITFSL